MKTIGTITHTRTSEFQKAVFLNDPTAAYELLDSHLRPNDWYPENMNAWTDIAVEDGKYYAVYGEDSIYAQDAECIYIEIEPSEKMKEEFEYFQKY